MFKSFMLKHKNLSVILILHLNQRFYTEVSVQGDI
jgi:hypothetical protein